jgi:tape measure domain-containing protein
MAQNIIFRVVADTQPAVDGMNKLGNATDKTKKEVSGLDQALGKVGNMLEGAFSLDSIIAFGKQVFTLTGQVQSLTIRMNELMGSQSAGTQQMNSLRELSDKLGMSFKTVSNEFVSFVGAAKASGMEVGKAEKIFRSMTIAIAGSGASSEATTRAMTALTQMIGKNKISAEELRGQLGEALPQSFGIMAKALGVTTQQLDKMMASGQLMADEVLPKFAKEMEKSFGPNAQTMAEGMQGNMARLQNAWEGYMTSLGERFYGSAGGAQVLTDMLNWWTQINLTQEQYIRNESARLADASAEIGVAEKLLETQRERKKTSEEIQATFKRLQADEMAYAKERKALGDTEGYTMAVKTAFAYSEIVKSMDVEIAKKKEVIPLTNAQIKQIEKERLERARLKREMDKALKDIFTVDFTKKVEDPNLIGPPKPDDKYFKDAQDRRTKDEQDRLKEMRKWQGIFETEQGKAFQSELSELDQQYQAKLIKDEEYLVALSALRKKYGIEDKKNINNFESDILTTKAKKEQLKKDIVIEAATGTVDTLMAYKQKELDGEAEMVAKQREQGLISQEQYDQQLRAIKRKQAIADRINAIANIAIGTAVQVATNPPPLAPFLIAMGAIQAGIVLAQPLPYNKGTKRVPMMRGAVRGRDSVHAILTPDERVVPADINMQPGYSALLDLAQDKKISDKEAGFLAELATSGMRRTGTQQSIDPDVIGKAIAKHIPHTNVAINDRGIAVITERSQTEIRRLRRRIG